MPRDDEARRLLASARFSMALGLGTLPEALPVWEAAGKIFDALLAEKPDDVDRQRNVALVNKYIGGLYDRHRSSSIGRSRITGGRWRSTSGR